jgi:hypothetical protein
MHRRYPPKTSTNFIDTNTFLQDEVVISVLMLLVSICTALLTLSSTSNKRIVDGAGNFGTSENSASVIDREDNVEVRGSVVSFEI